MAFGDIGSVLDTIGFAAVGAAHSRIVRVNDTIALVIFGDTSSDQKVATVEVDAAGEITDTLKDSLAWDGAWNGYNSICKRTNGVFVCSYRGSLDHVNIYGHLSTVHVGAAGLIPASTTDDATFDTSQIQWSNILYLAGNVVVVAYKDGGNDGMLKTFMVTTGGMITEPAEDTFEFDAGHGSYPHLCRVSDTVIAVCYTDAANNGQLFTIGIDAAGNIDAAKIDSYQFIAGTGNFPRICHVSGDIYAVAYEGWGPYCTVVTFEISAAGEITEPFKDSWYDNRWEGHQPSICKVSDSIVAVCYFDVANDGQLFTIGIDAAGLIDPGTIDVLEYELVEATYNDIVHMAGDIYLIVYRNGGTDLVVASIDIETPVSVTPHHEMIMKIGP